MMMNPDIYNDIYTGRNAARVKDKYFRFPSLTTFLKIRCRHKKTIELFFTGFCETHHNFRTHKKQHQK